LDGRFRVIDPLCMGCGNCREICFYGAVELLRDEKRGTPIVEILYGARTDLRFQFVSMRRERENGGLG